MDNLEIYNRMSEPPKSALRTIQAGRLKGMTDISPAWRYRIMTQMFGICGIGWKYTIDKTWLEQGANGEMVANAQVSVYIRDPETKEWSDAIVGVGGSMLIANEKSGAHTSDEAYKMAVTDAFSTSLKMLGVAAAIYEGRWDGSKYSAPMETSSNNKSAAKPSTAAADSPELVKAMETVKQYITDGLIDEHSKPKAEWYLQTKNMEGLRKTIDYIEGLNKQFNKTSA